MKGKLSEWKYEGKAFRKKKGPERRAVFIGWSFTGGSYPIVYYIYYIYIVYIGLSFFGGP